ncbi:TldD/PmbA family protein [Thermotoga neapolitana]|jgi:PmbA protein|uniref:PmbA-related protein n=1 Tax=Thermotoga neapolitana (strain ATCC 49049 / DSM 4359 / NBRC 107923 / NS-E) TaxID=309803 RepID=B9KAQ0_THENN|nr:TldD/PmbA family protein [Thermotoga neapolitana]ACM24033.1 PmbA-related protein [Thermotoga neapolitana DSM 4359]KFZ20825.1 PmbA-related protein [Thermotoga neapolitana LA10]HBF10921.1 TldD/PmbA family protein [Thermotoga neapolitana]
MTLEEFKDKLFAIAKRKGVEAQVSFVETREFSLRLANGELDQYTDAGKSSIEVKVLKEGKTGVFRTQVLEDPERCLEEALGNLRVKDSEEEEFFFEGGEYKPMETYAGKFERLSVKEKMEMAKRAHESASSDERIIMVPTVMYRDFVTRKHLSNTLGLNASITADGGYIFVMAVAKDQNPRSGFWFEIARVPEDLNPEEVGNRASKEAVSLIGSKSIESGKYPAVVRNTALLDLMEMFIPMISAENVQKNLSPLKGKLGNQVGNAVVSIKDLPYHSRGLASTPFDDEGVPTTEKYVLESGVLKTFLHNLKTAKKEGVNPTGNGFENGIQPVNLMMVPGNSSFNDLLKEMGKGVVITEVEGMHAGANSISGEFSLFAKGYWAENGEIMHGLEEFTISGNFLDFLKKIVLIGNDVKVSYRTIAPSVLVEVLDVAGK